MNIFRFRFQAMKSNCEVVLVAESKNKGQAIAAHAIAEVSRIERIYSRYRPESIVSRINAAAGQDSVSCDTETITLLQYADKLYETSSGLFDITSGVLRKAWNFSEAAVPSPETLSSLLPLVDWKRVEQKDDRVHLPVAGMELDFGGFGKEYAADRAAAVIHGKGVKSGYVNLAGDIRVIGPKPDGTPWVIGIQDPRHRERTIASIPLYSGALATSGDYERFFEADGKRYCHIIHPRKGYPVTYWRSVTVVAPLAITAGSYSTIAMLKEDDGLAFLKDSGMDYLAVDKFGRIYHNT
ncbi:FAD:protein FMN transferase [Chlorobium ferrooxidans]|uniref:FAD:protein FMN transferase n=1 Tax=Chlorobium ferrooxidans DSM 13031 TaxID=377431 RepID=Q0YTJ8_9CHLB|nr:FAD:protein FMN transferase [Chlorobium ferrooxidans]EAT59556.1 ApbE-like lipoprotein [Chlorobium ferrooxidans DSM 13031]